MKSLLSLAVLLSFFTSLHAKDEFPYPSYDAVVNRFFDEYSLSTMQPTEAFNFEKRPAGWKVTLTDYSGKEPLVIKTELFWNRENDKYEKLSYIKKKKGEDDSEKRQSFLSAWDKSNFDLSPYYGYTDWDHDVIQDFESKPDLSDSLLYALGRAYSSYASNLLHNNSGFANKDRLFKLKDGKNSMTQEQLEEYRKFQHKAFEKYDLLRKRNPDFQTIVGTIEVKAANEYMSSFLNLLVYQNEEEALKELSPDLYPDFYKALAKNYLSSCPKNAILFTNGDVDTYSLLYLQATEDYRTDVLVVNTSLIQTPRYRDGLADRVFDSPGLPSSLPTQYLEGKWVEILYPADKSPEYISIDRYLGFFQALKDLYPKDYLNLPNKIKFDSSGKTMEWETNDNYILRSYLVLLDAINTNNWQRPICIAVTYDSDFYPGLNNYFVLKGLVYQLTATKNTVENGIIKTVDTDFAYDMIMNKFDWSGLDSVKLHEKLFTLNYRTVMHKLANALIDQKKLDSAKTILKKSLELMPDEKLYYDYYLVGAIEAYYRLGDEEKADELAKKTFNNLTNDINNYKGIITAEYDYKEWSLEALKTILNRYEQFDLIKELY